MTQESPLYEEREFIYTSETVQPNDWRTLEKAGWRTVRRIIRKRHGEPPLYIKVIRRPVEGAWPKAKPRRTP